MNPSVLYGLVGLFLFFIGFYGFIARARPLQKILAYNLMGSGVFMILTSLARRLPGAAPDPVPHAMVLTGIVVSVSATAFALLLARRIREAAGQKNVPGRTRDDARTL